MNTPIALNVPGAHDTAARFRLSANSYTDASLQKFNAVATLTVASGACHLQTYLTPQECDDLAAMLVTAAREVREALAAANEVPA